MLDTGIPLWLRLHINELIAGYQRTVELCEQRCTELQNFPRRNSDNKRADACGTIDEYRMDAKYCAGQIVRLKAQLEGRLTPEEEAEGDWREIPRDPRLLSEWAWTPLADEPAPPTPDPDVRPPLKLRLHEVLADFSPRQRQVIIYGIGGRWKPEDIADKLEMPLHLVKRYLKMARNKFQENEKKQTDNVLVEISP